MCEVSVLGLTAKTAGYRISLALCRFDAVCSEEGKTVRSPLSGTVRGENAPEPPQAGVRDLRKPQLTLDDSQMAVRSKRMPRVHSFEPIEDQHAEVLILGSMPGRASLAAGQYYAHAQNAFWRILCELLRIDPGSAYEQKAQALKSARIALWDVLRSCAREGSLDAAIERDTQVANDFRSFFATHQKIKRVCFNGATAEACFNRHVLHQLGSGSIRYLRLPSTSPAHASMAFEQKLEAWRAAVDVRRLTRRTEEN